MKHHTSFELILLLTVYIAAQLALIFIPQIGIPIIAVTFAAIVYRAMNHSRLAPIYIATAILIAGELAGLITFANRLLEPEIVMYGVIYALALFYWLKFVPHKAPPRAYTFHLLYIPIMIIIGSTLGFLGVLLRDHLPLLTHVKPEMMLVYIPFLVIAEELVLRRMVLHEVARMLGPLPAVIFVILLSSVFGFSTDPISLGFGMLSALAISSIYASERNLLYPIILNMVMKYTFVIIIMTMS